MLEYIDIYRGNERGWVLTDDPRPREGKIHLSDAPGFGYELNRAAFEPGSTVAPIW
jgi:L-alanine-DL-glutamate epimerase-like enolase superfamily enzyme